MVPISQRLRSRKKKIISETNQEEEDVATSVGLHRSNSSVLQPLAGASFWDENRNRSEEVDGISSVGIHRRSPSLSGNQTQAPTHVVRIHHEEEEVTSVGLENSEPTEITTSISKTIHR